MELRTCAVPGRDLKDMENKMTKPKAGYGNGSGGKKRQLEVPVIPDVNEVDDDQEVYQLAVSSLLLPLFCIHLEKLFSSKIATTLCDTDLKYVTIDTPNWKVMETSFLERILASQV